MHGDAQLVHLRLGRADLCVQGVRMKLEHIKEALECCSC